MRCWGVSALWSAANEAPPTGARHALAPRACLQPTTAHLLPYTSRGEKSCEQLERRLRDQRMEGGKPDALCWVCGDKASGKHYGVPSCDGCRGFFKRTIRRNLEYVCKENGRCVVDVTRRNQCQACRFSKCLRVNMKKDAVQHERASRPSVNTPNHLELQRLTYNLSRRQNFIPSPTPITTAIPSLHTYGRFSPFSDSLIHTPFVERVSSQHFPASSLAEEMRLSPLTAHGPFNPFRIPLFPTSLHYTVPQPGYFPTNMLYPPMISSDAHSLTIERSDSSGISGAPLSLTVVHDKPDSQQPDQIKEDEVSSSGEAFKMDSSAENATDEGTKFVKARSITSFEPPFHVVAKPSALVQSYKEFLKVANKSACPNKGETEDWRLTVNGCFDPAAKLLVLSIGWLHEVASFAQLKDTEQAMLLHCNWRELFVLTAMQYSFYFDEYQTTSMISVRKPNFEENLTKTTQLLKKMSEFNLEKTEYDWLKTALLFRSDPHSSSQLDLIQDQTIASLKGHSLSEDLARFSRIMLLVAKMCCLANQGVLEQILFPDYSLEDINSTLTRILRFSASL